MFSLRKLIPIRAYRAYTVPIIAAMASSTLVFISLSPAAMAASSTSHSRLGISRKGRDEGLSGFSYTSSLQNDVARGAESAHGGNEEFSEDDTSQSDADLSDNYTVPCHRRILDKIKESINCEISCCSKKTKAALVKRCIIENLACSCAVIGCCIVIGIAVESVSVWQNNEDVKADTRMEMEDLCGVSGQDERDAFFAGWIAQKEALEEEAENLGMEVVSKNIKNLQDQEQGSSSSSGIGFLGKKGEKKEQPEDLKSMKSIARSKLEHAEVCLAVCKGHVRDPTSGKNYVYEFGNNDGENRVLQSRISPSDFQRSGSSDLSDFWSSLCEKKNEENRIRERREEENQVHVRREPKIDPTKCASAMTSDAPFGNSPLCDDLLVREKRAKKFGLASAEKLNDYDSYWSVVG